MLRLARTISLESQKNKVNTDNIHYNINGNWVYVSSSDFGWSIALQHAGDKRIVYVINDSMGYYNAYFVTDLNFIERFTIFGECIEEFIPLYKHPILVIKYYFHKHRNWLIPLLTSLAMLAIMISSILILKHFYGK